MSQYQLLYRKHGVTDTDTAYAPEVSGLGVLGHASVHHGVLDLARRAKLVALLLDLHTAMDMGRKKRRGYTTQTVAGLRVRGERKANVRIDRQTDKKRANTT
jgi:hypothetical protein